ncbi:hypothetical protein PI125_g6535 [Phytophthora idaei]|nr:hypothetical protein PI125_g6535 [Phytophthora idaei]KAG3163053.1 hypothetical protein PI126_g5729 [Phytophthora idaei]
MVCDRVGPSHYANNNMTCHQIWHLKWKNGEERPRPRVGRDIQMRGLGKKRRRRALAPVADADEDEEAKEEADREAEVGGDSGESANDGTALASAAEEKGEEAAPDRNSK